MELNCGEHFLPENILERIEIVSNSECSSKQVSDGLRNTSKELYDHIYKRNIWLQLQSKALRKLLVDGFDSEQIFQQIELQNKSALEHFNKCISSIDDKYTSTIKNESYVESSDDEEDLKIQTYSKNDLSENKEYIFDDDSDSSADSFTRFKPSTDKSADSLHLSDDDEDEEFLKNMAQSEDDEGIDANDEKNNANVEVEKKSKKEKSRESHKRKFHSVVDDQFFKLSNLSEFLRIEDIKAENEEAKFSDDDDEDFDYFEDIPSDDFDDSEDEMSDEGTGRKSSKNLMYDDFFDPPESGDENVEGDEAVSNEESDQTDLDEEDDDEEEGMKNDSSNESKQRQEDVTSETSKTPFEIEQDKIKKTISEFEERMIQKPEWHLTGEVAASNRPKDSLLHQDTDYDTSAKPVLVEDDDLLKKTEKAIISIIKNKAFSDGQRTVKPMNDVASLKKEIVLDQNKSKKSLAQVYEEDYLKKKYGEQEQENPKHVEIKKMMDSLLPELQALFSHIPKPAIPDIKIVSNLPAITVEEVAPTSISDVTLLAPEEIKKKTGTIKGQSERSDSDRKRERRKKKMFQRMKFKKMEKEANENPLSSKARKLDKMNALKKLKQNRNTKVLEGGAEKIKSSKDFFSRLQDSVHSDTRPSQNKKKKVK